MPAAKNKPTMKFGVVVIAACILGFSSFGLLVLAIGSEYWYVIHVNPSDNCSDRQIMEGVQSSHAGLWRIYEGPDNSPYIISDEAPNHTALEKHLLRLHRAVVVLLPLNLLLLVAGGLCSLYSVLTSSSCLLKATATYILLCSLCTLSGVSLYVSYSQQALAEVRRTVDAEMLSRVQLSFGWSLAVACLSFCLQACCGLLLLWASCIAQQLTQPEGQEDATPQELPLEDATPQELPLEDAKAELPLEAHSSTVVALTTTNTEYVESDMCR
ncbi:transmembrane protein 235-like [Engraulis encrasicolus]|uniref:transmembrane protein 235-like n=1 Tax=Engraulis encrasicolus TaxID=184585 RepID=UPI002FD42856